MAILLDNPLKPTNLTVLNIHLINYLGNSYCTIFNMQMLLNYNTASFFSQSADTNESQSTVVCSQSELI